MIYILGTIGILIIVITLLGNRKPTYDELTIFSEGEFEYEFPESEKAKPEYKTIYLGYDDEYTIEQSEGYYKAFRDEKGVLHRNYSAGKMKVRFCNEISCKPGIYNVVLNRENITFLGYIAETKDCILEV